MSESASLMEMLKKIGMLLLGGVLFGASMATLIAPRVLAWYNTGSDANALCNCANVAKAVTSQLIRAQVIGAIIGAVIFVIGGLIIIKLRGNKKPASTTAATP